MKNFNAEEFFHLLSLASPFFKLTDHNGGYFMTMGLIASEADTGIGSKNEKFTQTWELKDIVNGPDDEAVLIFKMWGTKPDFSISGQVANMFGASHEGKELIAPISSILSMLMHLTTQAPEIFSIDKYSKTQGLENIFRNKDQYYEEYPDQLIDNLKKEIGNTCIIYPEIKGTFPNPPFKSHVTRINKNDELLNTKPLSGTLKLFKNAIVLDNQRELHYPKWDLGYEPDSDFILSIRLLFGSYVMEFHDKKSNKKIEFAIEDFKFIGKNA